MTPEPLATFLKRLRTYAAGLKQRKRRTGPGVIERAPRPPMRLWRKKS
jgi:hypothetical protein